MKLTLAQHHLNTQAHDKLCRVQCRDGTCNRYDDVSHSGDVNESKGQNGPSVCSILQSHETPQEIRFEREERLRIRK